MKIFIKKIRKEKKLTLEKLSEMTGISKTTLNYIENEKVSPRMDALELIAMALNVHIIDLFDSPNKI